MNFCPRCRALSLVARTSFLILSIVTSFFFTFTWLLRIFVLLGCIPKPTDSELLLKSHNISSNLFSDVENSSTLSAKRKFVWQSSFLALSPMPFCFSCLCFRSSSRENCSAVLYSRLDRRSPCFVSPFDRKHVTFFCLSRLFLLDCCKAAGEVARTKIRYRSVRATTTRPNVLFGQPPS